MPFATVNSHRIHYVESSELGYDVDTNKAPIVMVHGLGSSQNFYVPIFPSLTGHRCVALSTYGAAQSKSKGEKLTLEELADDAIGLMDHLKIEKAILAGHSMGGPMVLTAAARHPERVLGVVPIGPVNPASIKPEMFTGRIETVLKGEESTIPNSPLQLHD
jgi:pimeloyl-ACP methyl ester carboxylesterase